MFEIFMSSYVMVIGGNSVSYVYGVLIVKGM